MTKGPNSVVYYRREVLKLFAHSKNISSPRCTQKFRKNKFEDSGDNNGEGSDQLSSCGIEEGMSASHVEMLEGLLKESVTTLNKEMDEVSDLILSVHRIQKHLRDEDKTSDPSGSTDESMGKSLSKKQNIPYSTILSDIHRLVETIGSEVHEQLRRDFKGYLENGGSDAQTALVKFSDDLLRKIICMEQNLEEYVDTVLSNCREMSLSEKQLLRQRIQKLPEKSLDRVVRIIQCRRPADRTSSNDIAVNLNHEDKATLWRLYYYVEMLARGNNLL